MKKISSQSSLSTQKEVVKQDGAITKKDDINFSNLSHKYSPEQTLIEATDRYKSLKSMENYKNLDDDPIVRVLAMSELDKGSLLSLIVSKESSTFAIDLMRKIQTDYGCVSSSEKAIAELASSSFVRALDIQKKIKSYLDMGEITGNGVQYLGVLSKDLDRAHNQYLTAVQTLKSFRQPPLQVNIKTKTAVIGNNQLVQTNEINDSN